jgi:hypothetical protein
MRVCFVTYPVLDVTVLAFIVFTVQATAVGCRPAGRVDHASGRTQSITRPRRSRDRSSD